MIQAEAVAKALIESDPTCQPQLVPISAAGDTRMGTSRIQDQPLAMTKGVDFTGALDQALYDGIIDVAVHSLKDIPANHRWLLPVPSGESTRTTTTTTTTTSATASQKDECATHFGMTFPLPREDPADVLLGPYASLHDLPYGCVVGTSSIRRQAQLRSICHGQDIQLVNLRGNIDARIQALQDGTVQALILAQAGWNRLKRGTKGNDEEEEEEDFGRMHLGIHKLSTIEMVPGLGQGIVTAVVRNQDVESSTNYPWPQHMPSWIAASAERAFLNTVDPLSPWQGRPPLAGIMEPQLLPNEDGVTATAVGGWIFRGLLARPDGSRVLHASRSIQSSVCSPQEAEALGIQVGMDLLDQAGLHFFE